MLGQVFAFVFAMSALGTCFYLVNNGKDTAGLTALVGAIAVPLGVFVYQRTKR